ncbi:MAG: 3-hydroxyacyl-CoA dehydrogenase NAD-binding domain-containing protein, partial [Crocinitomicaceae bacterium]
MKHTIGVLGAGTMGAGIAQVAAQSGHAVVLVDLNKEQLDKAKSNL